MGLSTHVLETSQGQPAAGVRVVLDAWQEGAWASRGSSVTNGDGRCGDLLTAGTELPRGRYRIRFETGEFYAQRGETCLYPYVDLVFEVRDERHYHIPLLMTANGYTTYRGS